MLCPQYLVINSYKSYIILLHTHIHACRWHRLRNNCNDSPRARCKRDPARFCNPLQKPAARVSGIREFARNIDSCFMVNQRGAQQRSTSKIRAESVVSFRVNELNTFALYTKYRRLYFIFLFPLSYLSEALPVD